MLKVLSLSRSSRSSLSSLKLSSIQFHFYGKPVNLELDVVTTPRVTVRSLKSFTLKLEKPTTELSVAQSRDFSNLLRDCTKPVNKEQKAKMSHSQYVVGHDKSKNYFYIDLHGQSSTEQKAVAVLEYRWVQSGVVELFHTEVPPDFRGQGIAKVLAEVAFDFFCGEDAVIRPTCTYLQKYLREHPLSHYMNHVDRDFL